MTILHVEDDPTYAALVARVLADLRPRVDLRHVTTAAEALRTAAAIAPVLVLLDHRLPDGDGMQVLDALHAARPALPVIFLTVMTSPRMIVEALRAGASDYIVKDEDLPVVLPGAVRETLSRMGQPARAETAPRAGAIEAAAAGPLHTLIGESSAMRHVRSLVRTASATTAPVLIEGETGTGKEVVARAIHALSARRTRPFVPVNCAAVPEALAESEFFGHARGAFTGAYREKEGLFEAAHGGTLFLDEIEDLPLTLQAKMLRVLQDLEYRPLGTSTTRRADVRVVAASNQSATRLLQERRLRPDLYYRLCVLSIAVPPLRSRLDDVPALAACFLARFNARHGTRLGPLPAALVTRLRAATWPGNIRELENTLESLCVAADGNQRTLEEVVAELPRGGVSGGPLDERSRILHALEAHRWSRQAAARALGVSRVTLWRRMARLGIRDLMVSTPGDELAPPFDDDETAPRAADRCRRAGVLR